MRRLLIIIGLLLVSASPAFSQCNGQFPAQTACGSIGGGSLGPVPFSAISSGGSVTAVSVASSNGFAGTSSGGATPALTLKTTVTGLLKGNGTAISAATAGVDYLTPSGSGAALTGIIFSQIGSTPTTLAGYGITNGATNGANSNITSLSALTSLTTTGKITGYSGTAIPSGGTTGSGIQLFSTTNFGIYAGTGSPTLSAATGSLYLENATGIPYYNSSSGGSGVTWTQIGTGGGGGGNCTVSGGSQYQILVNNGSSGCANSANATVNAGALALGASGTVGTVALGNATSGTVTLGTVTGALGSVTASLPANSGIIAELNLAQTWSAAQTFTNGDLLLKGSSSGSMTLEAPAAASTYIMTFPAATDTVAVLGTAQAFTAEQTFGVASSTTGQIAMANSSSSHLVTIQAGNNSAAWTLTLPVSGGTNGYVLMTNGSGTTSWAAAGTPGGSNTQVQYNNSSAFGGISGATTDGTAMTFASGDFILAGSSSGSTILNAAATAGSTTATLPDNSGIIAELNYAQTWSAAQTFTNGDLLLKGSSSGAMTLEAPAVASTYVMTFPAVTDTVAVLGKNQTFSGIETFSGNIIASGLQSTGTSVASICIDASNNVFTNSGANCYSGGSASAGGSNTQVQYNSSGVLAANGGFVYDGTSVVSLGVAGTSVGSLTLKNATSGTATIQPATGALGTSILLLPAINTTATLATTANINAALPSATTSQFYGGTGSAGSAAAFGVNTTLTLSASTLGINLGHANTWTAAQTFTNGDFLLAGSSSGSMTLEAPAAASTYVMTFPAATDTVAVLGTAQTFSATETFTGHVVMSGLQTPGTISGSLCEDSTGDVFYQSGTNCYSSGSAAGSNTQVQYNSSGVLAASAAFTYSSGVVSLGVAGSTVGSVKFYNGTTGSITLAPVTGALGTVTLSLPAATATLATTANINTALPSATTSQIYIGTGSAGAASAASTLPSAVQGNITTVGTIGSGTWQGAVIGASYGGAGSILGILQANGLGTVGTITVGNGISYSSTTLSSISTDWVNITAAAYGASTGGSASANTTAINAAIAAAGNACVYIPTGTFSITTLTSISSGNPCLVGDGPYNSILSTTSATGNVLASTATTLKVSGIGFTYSGGGHRTGGAYISTRVGQGFLNNLEFDNCYYCIDSLDNTGDYDSIYFEFVSGTASNSEEYVRIGGAEGNLRLSKLFGTSFSTNPYPFAGIEIYSAQICGSGSDYCNPSVTASDSDFLTVQNGLLIDNAGGTVAGLLFTNDHFDTGVGAGIDILPTSAGNVQRSAFTNVWATSSTGGPGIYVGPGTGAAVSGLYFNNVTAVANSGGGAVVTNGGGGTVADIQFLGGTYSGNGNGYVFTVSSASATAGATYTNNSSTFTVLNTLTSGTTLYTSRTSGTNAPSGSTLTKATGTGASTITFSASTAGSNTGIETVGVSTVRIEGTNDGTGGGVGANASAGISVNGGSNAIVIGNTSLGNTTNIYVDSGITTSLHTNLNICTAGLC